MSDCAPIDLAEYRNAGVTLLGDAKAPPLGEQLLRGLPFQVGDDPTCCFVALGDGVRTEPLTIKIGQTARNVVVAHRLLDSPILQSGTVGNAVAAYIFRYASGDELRVPIRDRFEISLVPVSWGQLNFRSLPDVSDSPPPRYLGNFGEAGNRQTEARQAWPVGYVLWNWTNPRPEEPIASIVVEPAGPRFLRDGITDRNSVV